MSANSPFSNSRLADVDDAERERALAAVLPGLNRSVWIRFWWPDFDRRQIEGTAWQKSEGRKYNQKLMRDHGMVYVLRWAMVFALTCLWVMGAARLDSHSWFGGIVQGLGGLAWASALFMLCTVACVRQVVLHPLDTRN